MESIRTYMNDAYNAISAYLGLLPENSKIIFLGLDNAGKTTLMQVMAEDRVRVSQPTLHPTANELTFAGNRKFRAFDMGGHQTARLLWKDYMSGVDGIIFIIDAADRTRFEEAKIELHRVFSMDGLKDVPFIILGNKIDKPTAASEEEFRESLGLLPQNSRFHTSEITDKPSSMFGGVTSAMGGMLSTIGLGSKDEKEITYNRDPTTGALYNVFMCSIAKQMGYKEGFNWGIDLINIREKTESKTLETIGSFGSTPAAGNYGNYGQPQNNYGYDQQQGQYNQQQYGQQQQQQQNYGYNQQQGNNYGYNQGGQY